jgi:flagellar operon protein
MNILFHPDSIGAPKPVEPEKADKPAPAVSMATGDFAAMLHEAVVAKPVRFSAHAQRRLSSRGIEPGAEIMNRLQSAVDKADSKGSRDSLVLIDSLAFIVAVRNRTVVTAFDIEQLKDDVVTNIDSAVIS